MPIPVSITSIVPILIHFALMSQPNCARDTASGGCIVDRIADQISLTRARSGPDRPARSERRRPAFVPQFFLFLLAQAALSVMTCRVKACQLIGWRTWGRSVRCSLSSRESCSSSSINRGQSFDLAFHHLKITSLAFWFALLQKRQVELQIGDRGSQFVRDGGYELVFHTVQFFEHRNVSPGRPPCPVRR